MVVSDVDADRDKLGMAVNADAVGLQMLNLNPLVAFRSDGNLDTSVGYVDRHSNIPVLNRLSFLIVVVGRCSHVHPAA